MRQVQDMHSAELIWECMLSSMDLTFRLRNATSCPLWYQLREWSWGWYALGSDGSPDKEINAKICKANQALGYPHAHVLNQHNNYVQCSCSHQPVAWMWDLYTPHKKALKSYRVLLGVKDSSYLLEQLSVYPCNIHGHDKITKQEVLERAESTSTETAIPKAQLLWADMSSGWTAPWFRDSCFTVSSLTAEWWWW